MSIRVCAQILATLAVSLFMGTLIAGPTPIVMRPSQFAISPPQSLAPTARPASGPTVVIPVRTLSHPAGPEVPDRALQTVYGELVNVTPGIQFDGVGFDANVPDDGIAIGANHIVQTVNFEYAVYDKSGHLFSGYPKSLVSIFDALGAPCNAGVVDPIGLYDRVADRWVISGEANSNSSHLSECIAVSTTNDPTGTYALYAYDFGTTLNDSPRLGVWPTASNPAYLATYNLFANGSTFLGGDACAYDRTAMLAASPSATQICFEVTNEGGFLPSDMDGTALAPAGSPGYFLNFFNTSTLHFFKLTPNFASPANSTFTGPTALPVATFTEACRGGSCIPQPGTSEPLDSASDRLMYRLAYRNFGDHEALVTNHSVKAGSSVGVRWYEVRNPNGAVNVFQQGTFAPDATFRWVGSIGMDKAGDIAMGYSVSSSSIFPGISYTGRLPSDPPGTMESEAILLTGGGSQTATSDWGRHSAIQIDPSDDCTFWYTNEYFPVTSTVFWSTRIGSFAFPNCTGGGGGGDFTITAAPASETTHNGSVATYTVTVAPVSGFSGAVSLALAGEPARSVVAFTPPTITGPGSSTLTVDTSRRTTNGTYTLTITGTSGSLSHSTTVTLVDQ